MIGAGFKSLTRARSAVGIGALLAGLGGLLSFLRSLFGLVRRHCLLSYKGSIVVKHTHKGGVGYLFEGGGGGGGVFVVYR